MKILNICAIIFISLLCFGCQNSSEPEYVRISNKIVKKYLNDMFAFHGLTSYGEGGAFFERVNEIIIAFQVPGPKTQDELRELLVKINEDLLQRFNDNEEIRPFLKNYPFTAENLSIGILLTDKNGVSFHNKKFEREELQMADQFYGKISYRVNTAEMPFSRVVARESYEEALAIVKAEIK